VTSSWAADGIKLNAARRSLGMMTSGRGEGWAPSSSLFSVLSLSVCVFGGGEPFQSPWKVLNNIWGNDHAEAKNRAVFGASDGGNIGCQQCHLKTYFWVWSSGVSLRGECEINWFVNGLCSELLPPLLNC
jgi:hypothetical protein